MSPGITRREFVKSGAAAGVIGAGLALCTENGPETLPLEGLLGEAAPE